MSPMINIINAVFSNLQNDSSSAEVQMMMKEAIKQLQSMVNDPQPPDHIQSSQSDFWLEKYHNMAIGRIFYLPEKLLLWMPVNGKKKFHVVKGYRVTEGIYRQMLNRIKNKMPADNNIQELEFYIIDGIPFNTDWSRVRLETEKALVITKFVYEMK